MRDAELLDQGAEAPERSQRANDRIGGKPAGGGQRAAKPAQHLLVEERRRRTTRAFIDDETHRV
jgi:hypothetical protein